MPSRFAFVALLLASCATHAPAPPSAPPPVERPALMVAGSSAAATDQPGPAVELDSSPQAEIWEGEYTCPQGITALTLRITRREGTTMEAVFSFRASEKNPGVPSGAFTLVGNMRADRSFELTPSQWIDRPDRYVMVGMAGEVDAEGTTMRGRITEAVCGGFELRRAR